MARRRSPEITISLFPFLSILACTIGVLTLVIMSLSLSQIAQGRENEEVVRAEEGAALKKKIAQMREEIAAAGEGKVAALEKIKLEDEISKLKEAINEPEVPADLEDQLADVEASIAAREKEKKLIQQEKKKLEDELARFEELKNKPKVLIQPSGGSSKIRPQFVETRKDGIVIHAVSRSIPVKTADLANSADYKKLVGFVRAGEASGRTIVFLIRQDGLGTFARARDVALAGGAGIAKLPLIGEGSVDLAAFGIKRKEGE